MKITGATIIKAGVLALAGLFSVGVYAEYKELKAEEEKKKKEYDECLDLDMDDYVEMTTGDMVRESIVRCANDMVRSITDDPISVLEGVAIGCIGGLCYIAGTNDGIRWTKTRFEKLASDAWNDGVCLGFAGGRKNTREHIRVSNPETADTIINNLDIYEKLHNGTDEMRFNSGTLMDDPEIYSDYSYMKEHMKEAV